MSEQRPSAGFAAALAGIVFFLGMVIVHAFKLPLMRYHPIDRVWELSATGGSVPMMYYGQILWAGLAALAVFGLVRLLKKSPPSGKTWLLTGGWLLLSCVVALSYYAHANWP